MPLPAKDMDTLVALEVLEVLMATGVTDLGEERSPD